MIPTNIVCTCGRRGFVHCPVCGLKSIYALDEASVVVKDNGLDKTLQGFKCSKCGCKFRMGTPCNAPPTAQMLVAQRVAEDRSEPAKRNRRAALAVVRNINPQRAAELEKQYVEQGLI